MSLLHYLYVEPQSKIAKYSFRHKNKNSFSRAYESKETVFLSIDLPSSFGASDMFLEVFKADQSDALLKIRGKYQGRSKSEDTFTFKFNLERGLYFLRPSATAFGKTFYGRKNGDKFIFDGIGEMLQLTVSDFLYNEPTQILGGIIYHIFVDRFNRGGEVIYNEYNKLVEGNWDVIPEYPAYPGAPLKNNTLYGGTLYGIIDKLDYISSLGCNAIYLSPIFESVSNHKYDTADYMNIDPCFGGMKAFEKLILETKKRGILVILDGVFNHTGDDSKYFNRYGRYDGIGAYQSKDSEYYDWYDFKKHPDKYTCWWDIEILPRINPDNPKCSEFFVGKNGVIDKYRKMGVYGFRLDVADELSDDFISKIKSRLNQGGEDSILYGEVWEDASNKIAYETRKQYYLGSELDGVMNYPLRRGLIDYVLNSDTKTLEYYFKEVLENTPDRIRHCQMNFLGTHDTERILTILGGESSDGHSNDELCVLRMSDVKRENAVTKLASLYTVLATLPGIPSIFYGDEAGLEGYSDPFNRMPYPFGRENTKLLQYYKNVGAVRRNYEIYKSGDFRLIEFTPKILAFERFDSENSYVTIFNNSSDYIIVSFKKSVISLLDGEKGKNIKISSNSAAIIKSTRINELSF